MAKTKTLTLPEVDGETIQLFPFGTQCAAITNEDLKNESFVEWLKEARPEIFKQITTQE